MRTPFTAVALDGRVDLADAAARLGAQQLRRYAYGVFLRTREGMQVHVFAFGAFVTEGAAGATVAGLEPLAAALGRTLLPDTVDTWYVREDPDEGRETPRAGWDQVVITERTPERLAAFALLIGQSAALERHEHGVERLLEEVAALAQTLERRGRPPQRSRRLLQRIGRINAARLELARWFFLLSRPEEAWERPEVAALYDALFRNLELEERHRAVLHKLDAAGRGLRTVVDLWHARWAHWLEWAIVILIVIELVVALGHWG